MDLNIFKKDSQETSEYFWSLVIDRGWVQAGIWHVAREVAEIISEGAPAAFEEGNQESLVSAADSTLSSCASGITTNIQEPNKVVFGLPTSWITDGNISENRIETLKKLSQELELEPSGFVVVPEAIVHLLKAKEGAPLQGILIGVSENVVDVSLVTSGKVLGTQEVTRNVSMGADVAEGLAKLPLISQYPSRILVYSLKAGDLDDARQNLLETDWGLVKVNFLHTPKVEILSENVVLAAVSLAGGAEVGAAKTIDTSHIEEVDEGPVTVQEEALDQEIKSSLSDIKEASEDETGFVQDKDAAELEDEHPEFALPQEELERHANIRPTQHTSQDYAHLPPTQLHTRRSFNLGKLFGFLGVLKLIKLPGINFGLRGVSMVGIVGVGLLLAIVAFGIVYWFVPRSNVTIYVAPKKQEKVIEFATSPVISSLNLANNTVPAQVKEVEISGDKTAQTTGTKLTGERAKGAVTITNVSGSKALKSGTILTGPNSLKFTLNSDTTVASASSAAKPSQTNAAVTAGDIGAQFNLASGTEFSISNFSKFDIVATNSETLNGGTSREVSAVSEKDRENIENDLTQELMQKVIEETKQSLGEDEVLVEESIAFSNPTRDFSHKVGEETSSLKLSLKGNIKMLIIQKSSLNELVMAKLGGEVPLGYALKEEQIELSIRAAPAPKEDTKSSKTKTAEPKENFNFIATATANLLPKVEPDEIKKNISGKYPTVAKEYLSTIPGFTRAEISMNIKFPGIFGTLPRSEKNINIEIAAER